MLTYQQRELATIAVLSALDGVASQLEFHLAVGLNIGFKEDHLKPSQTENLQKHTTR